MASITSRKDVNDWFGVICSNGVAIMFLLFGVLMALNFSQDIGGKLVWSLAIGVISSSLWYMVPRIKRLWINRHRAHPDKEPTVLGDSLIDKGLRLIVGTKPLMHRIGFGIGWLMLFASLGIQTYDIIAAVNFSVVSLTTSVQQANTEKANTDVDPNDSKKTEANNSITRQNGIIATQTAIITGQTALMTAPGATQRTIDSAQKAMALAQKAITDATVQIEKDKVSLSEAQTALGAKATAAKKAGPARVDERTQITASFDQTVAFLAKFIGFFKAWTGQDLLTALFMFIYFTLALVMWLTWEPLEEVVEKSKRRAFDWETMEKYILASMTEESKRMLPDHKVSELTKIPLETCQDFKELMKKTVYQKKPLVISRPGITEATYSREGMIKVMKFLSNVTVEAVEEK